MVRFQRNFCTFSVFIVQYDFSSFSEQYDQAVSDFKACIDVHKSMAQEDERALAEIYYQLGVAYNYNYHYDDAIASFKSAVELMQAKQG